MKIGIMGLGFVGGATKEVFQTKHNVVGYDPIKEGYKDPSVLKDTEVTFICVPTPMKEDGSADISYVTSACETIKNIDSNIIACIKSTVPPGTSDSLEKKLDMRIGHNPEFLRERYAIRDLWASDRIIIGGTWDVRRKIKEVYKPLFPDVIYKELTNKEAEMVKHTTNAFLASQVGFANEIYNICNKLGIDYNNVKETIYLDKRLGRHIDVPGTDDKLGFGGHCLPKDLNGLISYAKQNNYNPTLLNELWRFNKRQRK